MTTAPKVPCPICRESVLTFDLIPNYDRYRVECKICGTYSVDGLLFNQGQDSGINDSVRYLLSAVLRESSERGQPLFVTYSTYRELVLGRDNLTLNDKALKLLRWLEKKSDHFGDSVEFEPKYDYPVAFCKNQKEFVALIQYLSRSNLIENLTNSGACQLSPEGLALIEQVSQQTELSNKVFVAMWFEPSLAGVYAEAIEPAVQQCGYTPIRIDKLEHNQKIDDLIISSINDSKFLIADFTGHRQSVYFEAGYALGQKKDVIWICRKDAITDCHFDTRQYNHIVWEDASDLLVKLEQRILAVIGRAL